MSPPRLYRQTSRFFDRKWDACVAVLDKMLQLVCHRVTPIAWDEGHYTFFLYDRVVQDQLCRCRVVECRVVGELLKRDDKNRCSRKHAEQAILGSLYISRVQYKTPPLLFWRVVTTWNNLIKMHRFLRVVDRIFRNVYWEKDVVCESKVMMAILIVDSRLLLPQMPMRQPKLLE